MRCSANIRGFLKNPTGGGHSVRKYLCCHLPANQDAEQAPQVPSLGDWRRPPALPECPAHPRSGIRRCTDGVTS